MSPLLVFNNSFASGIEEESGPIGSEIELSRKAVEQ